MTVFGRVRSRWLLIPMLILMVATIGCREQDTPAQHPPLKAELGVTIPVETALDTGVASTATDIWLDMIRNANRSLELGHFYLSSREGEDLERIITALADAHQRGVSVRILTDVKMNQTYPETADRFRAMGIPLRLFDWRELTGGILHAKYMIADGKSLYVGSQNFDWRALKHIHETGIRVNDETIAAAALALFNADWDFADGDADAYNRLKQLPPFSFTDQARLLASPAAYNPPGVDGSLDHLVRILDGATRRISIQLLSYSTHRYKSEERFTTIDDALRRAAARGVEVEMIISNWNKRHPEDLKSLSAVPGIRVMFINIPESSEGFVPFARVVHSKVVRVDDDICWISTSNWSYDYFYASRNLELLLKDHALAVQLDRLFTNLWNSPYEEMVTPDGEYTPPRRQ